tara:strand:+ start:1004 stop:1189 length:186 start_codon:yes stop_codon:yes gene_type:complete
MSSNREKTKIILENWKNFLNTDESISQESSETNKKYKKISVDIFDYDDEDWHNEHEDDVVV